MSAASYNEFPYHDLVISQTHPNRMAGMARLFGLKSPSPSQARILELGCGTGLNLLSIASSMPESSCLGIDYAEKQIEIAEARRENVGVHNLKFRAISVADIDESFGKFDYIIAHGLFSWVSDEIRSEILRVCSQNLSEHGVVYISYNVLPGGYIRQIHREAMLFHTEPLSDSQAKVSEGIKFVKLMAAQPSFQVQFGVGAQEAANRLDQHEGAYIFHEYLEDENKSFYFSEFINQAMCKGLCYVADADFYSMLGGKIEQSLRVGLFQEISDRVRREQYMDIFSPRAFRRSLLGLGGAPISDALVSPGLDDVAFALRISMPVISPFSSEPFEVNQISDPRQSALIAGDIPLRVILSLLHSSAPQAVSLGNLSAAFVSAYRAVGKELPVNESLFGGFLFRKLIEALSGEYIDILAELWPGIGAGVAPDSTKLARYLVQKNETVVTLFHTMSKPDNVMSAIIELADGERGVQAMATELTGKIIKGELSIDGQTDLLNPVDVFAFILKSLPANIEKGKRLGFFRCW